MGECRERKETVDEDTYTNTHLQVTGCYREGTALSSQPGGLADALLYTEQLLLLVGGEVGWLAGWGLGWLAGWGRVAGMKWLAWWVGRWAGATGVGCCLLHRPFIQP